MNSSSKIKKLKEGENEEVNGSQYQNLLYNFHSKLNDSSIHQWSSKKYDNKLSNKLSNFLKTSSKIYGNRRQKIEVSFVDVSKKIESAK